MKTADIADRCMDGITTFLSRTLDQQGGVVGFAPGLLEDADDTARTILSLQRLGHESSPEQMVKVFQEADYFKTYELERNSSFSANCNVLLSLLECSQVDNYQTQIQKALEFILRFWERGPVSDKWNHSPAYSLLLLTEVMVNLLESYNSGFLQSLPTTLIFDRIPGTLCSISAQLVCEQQKNGSWADHCEITAYGALTIGHSLRLPWPPAIQTQLRQSLVDARSYITTHYSNTAIDRPIWVEKISYRARLLEMVYCSAALYMTPRDAITHLQLATMFTIPEKEAQRFRAIFLALPLFQQKPLKSIDLALIEASLVTERLRLCRNDIIDRGAIPMTKEKYLQMIPLIWIICNQVGSFAISPAIIWDMIRVSLLNYQIDELMESVTAKLPGFKVDFLSAMIRQECGTRESNGVVSNATEVTEQEEIATYLQPLQLSTEELHASIPTQAAFNGTRKYARYILGHGSVTKQSAFVQQQLAIDVQRFLLAHIHHNQENKTFASMKARAKSQIVAYAPQDGNYYDWVRWYASNDTSCPMSFNFFACLISTTGHFCFDGPLASYVSQALRQHLATMCRQYNDYGSLVRDTEENNLNSLDFAEFSELRKKSIASKQSSSGETANDCFADASNPDAPAKDALMKVAEFERASMLLCVQKLEAAVQQPATMARLAVFIDVTDAFGQVYVQQDIASRVKAPDQNHTGPQ